MKQVTLVAPKKFEVSEVPVPEINDDQILIKVKTVGICGSDIHAYFGHHPFMSCPIVLGHEASGEIVKLGANVKNLAIGDRIVMRPQKICNECLQCTSGRYNICNTLEVLGCQCTGASSDYYAMNEDLAYKLPDNLDYAEGTIIEPLAVGVHAVKRGADDITGKKVLVSGAGTIGNLVAQAAKGMGAAEVMITDVVDFKLDMAKKCGVDYAVNVAKEDLSEKMAEAFGPNGADIFFECTANGHALNALLNIARKGSNIVIVGVFGKDVSVNMANVQDREYNLIGTLMYMDEDYKEAIRLAAESKVDLTQLITNTYDLTQAGEAYKHIQDNKETTQKVILTV